MSTPKLRTSQLITTFGPGAMVDLPEGSVLISGLDAWNYDVANIPTIEEPRLLSKLRHVLGVESLTLRSPPPASDSEHGFRPSCTAWQFPEWYLVQNVITTPTGARKRRLVHRDRLEKDWFRDPDDHKKHSVVPVRFVRACKKGHLGDIDWQAFVHGISGTCQRELWMEERGTSGDLDEVVVTCECGAHRAMSQAARMELRALGSCDGQRLWLGPGTKESCGEPNRLLIRSASNAYFPQLLSVISIPDQRTPVDDVVRSLWDDFLSDVETSEELVKQRKKPTPAAKLAGIPDDVVMASIVRIRAGAKGEDRPVKSVELEALVDAKEELGIDIPDGEFFARTLPRATWNAPWAKPIERIVLVHRLREVVAQVGFTRFESAGPDINGELPAELDLGVKPARLALDAAWLPASENRGEGVFVQFNDGAVSDWLERPAVIARCKQLAAGFELWKAERKESKRQFPGLPYYLLHSFSHLLLTAISLECGYPASSLRERIYVEGGYGVLIYTGSSDAEGTLGGLILAARDIRRHMRRALEIGLLCSNDPVCAHHAPSPHDHQVLNGAACHGCLLIAETSCEQRNEFLDRALVVPTVEALGAEFFTDL